jgi:hypothetical protein
MLIAAALTVAGCQDGYPIPATRCDRWCHVRQATECGNYNPVSCVVSCEGLFGNAACSNLFDQLLRCLENPRLSIVCDNSNYGIVPECKNEQASLVECAMLHASPGSDGAE